MSRVTTVVVLGLLIAATFMVGPPAAPAPGLQPGLSEPRFAVCLVEEGGGRTTDLTVVSLDEGDMRASFFANGRTAGSMGVSIGAYGSQVVPVVDITAVGAVVGLVELPTSRGGAAALTRGADTLAAQGCTSATPTEAYLGGGSTVGGSEFDLHLMNPFAVDAVVRLSVSSEVGGESNTRFESITVVARSSVVLPMRQLIPAREQVSVVVESLMGRVVAFGRQSGNGQGAMWNAEAPNTDWFLPLPTSPSQILVGNPSGSEIQFQVDAYGESGMDPAVVSGVIPPQSQIVLDSSDFELEEAFAVHGVRIITTSPVVATLRSPGPQGLAVTPGVSEPASVWLVPGNLEAETPPEPEEEEEEEEPSTPEPAGRLVILNPSIDDAVVVVRSLGANPTEREFILDAEAVTIVEFGSAEGHIVESDVPIVVLWIAGNSDAMSMGVAIPDG